MIMLLGSLLTVLMLCFGSIGGSVTIYIDAPSFVIIAVPVLFFMGITKTYRSVVNYLKGSFQINHAFSDAELDSLSHDLGAIIKMTLSSGVFGFFAGFLMMLNSLSDPQMLGPFFAVSLLTVVYAVVFSAFVLYPTKIWAERELRERTQHIS